MNFRCKYMIAGPSSSDELYHHLKTVLEGYSQQNIIDMCESEVLGPYPEPDNQLYSRVPVTFKFNTFGYESANTILFDIIVELNNLRSSLTDSNLSVGIQEIVIDGDRMELPDTCSLDETIVIDI